MNHGFNTLKDVLEVLIIPLTIFIVGALLPSLFDAVKARKFCALIKRELKEMVPRPDYKIDEGKWHEHLNKRFVHEEIFKVENISENRDFILSLPPDVAYSTAQLWRHYEKAKASVDPKDLAEHGASWCDYLRCLCTYFDRRGFGNLKKEVYEPWVQLVLAYHPELRQTGRLPASHSILTNETVDQEG